MTIYEEVKKSLHFVVSLVDILMCVLCMFALNFRYIPSANECPLRLQLPNGEISVTNGFISPVNFYVYIYFSYQ